jgi:16S rRNA (cytosine967-C5)-methyltransferase
VRDAGRLAAAIGVIADIEERRRPARLALRAWGEASRFAGAKDRAFVSGLALDAVRRRRSLAWRMDDATPRAAALGVLRLSWDWPLERIEAAAGESPHGHGALTGDERSRLESPRSVDEAPSPVRGDYPDWLDPHLERAFGEDRAAHGHALAARAPVDLRVNTLKTDVAHVAKALAAFGPQTVEGHANALRIPAPHASERAAPVEATPEFEKGWFEVQDLASQIAAEAAGDIAHRQVLDFCAGGGGKTLALAAAMANTGQLWAHDADARRLAETVRRARRAGVRNLQVRSPLTADPLAGLEGRMDLVFIDAPCTGSGTWRRHPDAKWRLTPAQLERRLLEQSALLDAASAFVKPGGRLVYVTCSVLPQENDDRLAGFLAAQTAFALCCVPRRLDPLSTATDGFFIAVMERRGEQDAPPILA